MYRAGAFRRGRSRRRKRRRGGWRRRRGGKEVSTGSHNWSKVLMGERSHPPCEGWRGNVAGGNGFFSVRWNRGEIIRGPRLLHRAVRLPGLCWHLLSEWRRKDTHCVCLSVFSCAPKRHQCLIIILDLFFLTGMIEADTLAYSCAHIFPYRALPQLWNTIRGRNLMTKTKLTDFPFAIQIFIYSSYSA